METSPAAMAVIATVACPVGADARLATKRNVAVHGKGTHAAGMRPIVRTTCPTTVADLRRTKQTANTTTVRGARTIPTVEVRRNHSVKLSHVVFARQE